MNMKWTTEAVNKIIKLRNAGCTTPEIANALGVTYSQVQGYLGYLQKQGRVPRKWELPGRRSFPQVIDHRIRLLISHVLDWVWVHPNTEFEVTGGDHDRYFRMTFYDENSRASYVQVGEDRYWSQFRRCDENNLRTLIVALKLIDAEGKS